MKFILSLLLIFAGSFTAISQAVSDTEPHFFAQCLIQLPAPSDYTDLEQQLRQIPFVQVARVDVHSNRIFVLTKDLSAFDEQQFQSWLGTYLPAASCFQVGLHGTDPVHPYPFTNCSN